MPLSRWTPAPLVLTTLCACAGSTQTPPKSNDSGLQSSLELLSGDIERHASRVEKRLRLAVLDFGDSDGRVTQLGKYAAEKLITTLGRENRFDLIERSRLDQVLKELKLSSSELVSDQTATSIGNLLGADAVVVGTFTDLGDRLDLTCRIVEVETSRILGTGSASIARDPTVEKLWSATSRDPAPAERARRDAVGGGATETPGLVVFENPKEQGHFIDNCLHWAASCGEPSATSWCKTRGFEAAVDFAIVMDVPTLVRGDGRVCPGAGCGGFSRIECATSAALASFERRALARPEINGTRVDHCLHWGQECGLPAATEVCRRNGYKIAVDFAVENAGSAQTLVLGDGKTCGPNCDAFSSVTCIGAPR